MFHFQKSLICVYLGNLFELYCEPRKEGRGGDNNVVVFFSRDGNRDIFRRRKELLHRNSVGCYCAPERCIFTVLLGGNSKPEVINRSSISVWLGLWLEQVSLKL